MPATALSDTPEDLRLLVQDILRDIKAKKPMGAIADDLAEAAGIAETLAELEEDWEDA